MTMRRILFTLLSLGVGAFALPARAQEMHDAPAPIVLKYGAAYSTMRSIYALPIQIAQREGFFAKEGLDLKIVVPLPGGSDKMVDALYDGTVDVTHIAMPFLVRSVMKGSDAVAIATEFNNPIYSLVAKPEVKTLADLKGRMVAMADEQGSITIAMRKLLTQNGIGAADIETKVIEGTPARMACLTKGPCGAVPLGQPQDLAAQADGYNILGLSTDAQGELLYTVTAVRRSWAARNKEAVTRYVRALKAAHRFIRDPKHRDAVVATIVATNKVSEAVARATMTLYLEPDRHVLPREGEISLTGLQGVITMMSEAGLLQAPLPDPARFIDTQYLEAAGVN
jgi:ABC-type nitrate/sulfonate/bicarbonate transport system substrate-binding protein